MDATEKDNDRSQSGKGHRRPQISTSVAGAISRLGGAATTAARLAADLLITHPDYGAGRGKDFGAMLIKRAEGSVGAEEAKDASAWLEQVTALFVSEARIIPSL